MSFVPAFPHRSDAFDVSTPAWAEVAEFAARAPHLEFGPALSRALADDLARLSGVRLEVPRRRKVAVSDSRRGICE